MNITDDMVQAQTSPSPKLPQGVSELQDEISAIMERWREVGGGVYAVGGCSLEIAKHVLEAALSAQPAASPVEPAQEMLLAEGSASHARLATPETGLG